MYLIGLRWWRCVKLGRMSLVVIVGGRMCDHWESPCWCKASVRQTYQGVGDCDLNLLSLVVISDVIENRRVSEPVYTCILPTTQTSEDTIPEPCGHTSTSRNDTQTSASDRETSTTHHYWHGTPTEICAD